MHWLSSNWPTILVWAVVVLQAVPSLINGLIPEHSWSGRLRVIVNWLAHLTPPDKPGTFKKPFSGDRVAPNGKTGAVVLSLVPILLFCSIGCATLKSAEKSAIDCAKPLASEVVPDVIQALVGLAGQSQVDWQGMAHLE